MDRRRNAAGLVKRNHAIWALVLGVIELVLAAAIAICSFVLAGTFDASVRLTPYWAGLPYLIPGILGIAVGVTKNKCCMIGFMVVNIICFVINVIACIVLIIGVAVWTALASSANESGKCTYNPVTRTCRCSNSSTNVSGVKNCEAIGTISALILTIVAFACINCIVSLTASIIGCTSVCCGSYEQQPGAIIIQQPAHGQPGYGQQLGYPGQQPGYAGQQPGYAGQQPGYAGQPPPQYDMQVKQ